MILGAEAPNGCPKTLVVLLAVAATDPKPPLLANAEKPPEAAGVLLPNTLLVPAAPAEPKLDCPKAGVAVAVDWAAQGDGVLPKAVDGWPNDGAAGLAPNGDDPSEGAPNLGAAAAAELPNVLEPNAGAAAPVAAGVAHGLGFAPRTDGPPNAGVAAAVEAPNADGVLVEGAPNDGLLVAEAPKGLGVPKAGALGC